MNKQLAKAQHLLAAGRFQEAEKLCRKAILLGKDVPIARRMLANCLYNRSVLASSDPRLRSVAEALLREALRYDPGHLLAMNNLGSLLLNAFRPNEAAELFERALRGQEGNVMLLENLALAYQEAERMQDASRILLRLAELNPAAEAAYHLREALLAPAIPADRAAIRQARTRTETTLAELAMRSLPELVDPFRFRPPISVSPITARRTPQSTDCSRAFTPRPARLLPGSHLTARAGALRTPGSGSASPRASCAPTA